MQDEDPIEIVRNFMRDVESGADGPVAAFRRFLTPDCIWHNTGVPSCHGVEECIALFEASQQRLDYHNWHVDYRGIAADGDLVLTDRTDVLVDREGRTRGVVDVMGALRVAGGRITEWRDVFDPTQLGGSTAVGEPSEQR